MFFSGHTAMAVLGAVELVRFGGRWWIPIGILIALVEATTVLALRAHYTMDVFTGAIVALYASVLAERWAPWCDTMLARVRGGNSSATTPESSCVGDAQQR
jgi:membrane-associated phospholipid phosphatase